jgi:hypothetical protein
VDAEGTGAEPSSYEPDAAPNEITHEDVHRTPQNLRCDDSHCQSPSPKAAFEYFSWSDSETWILLLSCPELRQVASGERGSVGVLSEPLEGYQCRRSKERVIFKAKTMEIGVSCQILTGGRISCHEQNGRGYIAGNTHLQGI